MIKFMQIITLTTITLSILSKTLKKYFIIINRLIKNIKLKIKSFRVHGIKEYKKSCVLT